MHAGASAILKEIDEVLGDLDDLKQKAQYEDLTDKKTELATIVHRLRGTIARLAPKDTSYARDAESVCAKYLTEPFLLRPQLEGIARALRAAFASSQMRVFEEIVHADLFNDFLEMAEYLLDESFKDAAAVLGGGVLEESLRKHSVKNGIDTQDGKGKPKKASLLNDELMKARVYSALEHKQITAWLGIRNEAAHGHYGAYDAAQVRNLISGIRDFAIRHPS